MSSRDRLTPLAVLLITVLTGCGDAGTPPLTSTPALNSTPPPATPPPANASPTGAGGTPAGPGGFSTTDLAWLQLAIAMDERILRVLELVPGRADDPEVTALAGRLAATHRKSLARLRALRDRSGGPTANPHEGHDMPGMATGAQLDALRRATGPAAVDIFAAATRAHLDQSIRLAHAEWQHGTEPTTRAIAGEIERIRTEQRGQLDQLLS